MNIFFGQATTVQTRILAYLELVRREKDLFCGTLEEYFIHNDPGRIDKQVLSTHRLESKADDLRREIEQLLYGKALLPEFRGDVYRLLEATDRIPDQCETILFKIEQENLKIPASLVGDFKGLLETAVKCIDYILELLTVLFHEPKKIPDLVRDIDMTESFSDSLENAAIKRIFASPEVENFSKLLLKELVLMFGNISDESKKVADVVTIIHIKVRV
jgi:uncharacterized protein